MTTLKPYPDYKDSGVEWLSDIPQHWEPRRLSTLLARNDSGAWGSDHSDNGVKVLRSTEQTANGGWRIENPAVRELSSADIAKTLLKAGDLVVTTSSGSQKHIGKTSIVTAAMEAERYGFSNFMQRLRTSEPLLPRFTWYVINNQVGREQLVYLSTTTTGLANLNGKILGSIVTPLPPLDEQCAIADFLDGMDARITRFIAARRKMIALLEEKKQAVINQAVTRGLDPDVPMKDSGVDWLGEIPAHWNVRRSRYAFREVDHRAPDERLPRLSMSQKHGLVPITDIESWRLQSTSAVGAKIAGKNDLVLNRLKAHLAVFAHAPLTGTVSPDYTVLRPLPLTNVRYFEALYRTPLYRFQFFKRTKGIVEGFWRLYTDAFYDVIVPFPEPQEQQEIVDYIDHETTRINALISRHRREIELMQEYRMRLISDVVTSKLDVRGVELPAVEEIIGEEIEAVTEDHRALYEISVDE